MARTHAGHKALYAKTTMLQTTTPPVTHCASCNTGSINAVDREYYCSFAVMLPHKAYHTEPSQIDTMPAPPAYFDKLHPAESTRK